jgi:transcriptional regulator with XRE-family HTH domain
MDDIGTKIRHRRLQLDLTQQQVGEYINVSKATVQRYESGEIKNLKQETIEKLSEILKISPGYLLGWLDDYGNPTHEYIEKKTQFLLNS